MEAGTGLGEMTKPLARSFISKPKTSGEARAHTHTWRPVQRPHALFKLSTLAFGFETKQPFLVFVCITRLLMFKNEI